MSREDVMKKNGKLIKIIGGFKDWWTARDYAEDHHLEKIEPDKMNGAHYHDFYYEIYSSETPEVKKRIREKLILEKEEEGWCIKNEKGYYLSHRPYYEDETHHKTAREAVEVFLALMQEVSDVKYDLKEGWIEREVIEGGSEIPNTAMIFVYESSYRYYDNYKKDSLDTLYLH